jgi:1,2-phenylacetyl-CoA epoxidase catalytic subunit
MRKVERTELPKKYRDAIEHWCRHNFTDYPLLEKYWDKYFPNDEKFCLCAKMDLTTSKEVVVGDNAGKPKSEDPAELSEEAAQHLLAIIRAQASTEFGSIQQHQVTLDRAPDDRDKFWVLRVMAEELRHGYQMFHLLTSKDWSKIGGVKADDMVDDVLAMKTGSHVLEAFNVAYDSFVDNIVFAAVIDRVGKYQLTMQKVCAYRPMAQSMQPMLREEAFHLAAGVMPLRRWLEAAAKGNPLVTEKTIQKSLNKWVPRGLEMFGDERGGNKNLRFGFKDKDNITAQNLYYEELQKLVRNLNLRYLRARYPDKSPEVIDELYQQLSVGKSSNGMKPDEILRLPHREFFRRRGEPAYRLVGFSGERFNGLDEYVKHLSQHLPEPYLASRHMQDYIATLRQVVAGEVTAQEAAKKTPVLKRATEVCPCSKSVRWVEETEAASGTTNGGNGSEKS